MNTNVLWNLLKQMFCFNFSFQLIWQFPFQVSKYRNILILCSHILFNEVHCRLLGNSKSKLSHEIDEGKWEASSLKVEFINGSENVSFNNALRTTMNIHWILKGKNKDFKRLSHMHVSVVRQLLVHLKLLFVASLMTQRLIQKL